MRKILFLLFLSLILILCAPAFSQCTSPCVAATSLGYFSDTTAVTSSAINTTGATSIYLVASTYNGNSGFVVSDSKGNTWTPLTQVLDTNVQFVQLFYCLNPTVGSGHTFTISGGTGAAFPSLSVAAFSGTYLYDSVQSTNGAGSPTIAAGSITPSTNNSLIIAGVGFDAFSDIPSGITAGFTIASSLNGATGRFQTGIAWLLQNPAAPVNPTWSSSPSASTAGAVIASFKPAVVATSAKRRIL